MSIRLTLYVTVLVLHKNKGELWSTFGTERQHSVLEFLIVHVMNFFLFHLNYFVHTNMTTYPARRFRFFHNLLAGMVTPGTIPASLLLG